jgi:hypothetical protein
MLSEVDRPNRFGNAVQAHSDVLNMLAARLIVVADDDDVPVLEVSVEIRSPLITLAAVGAFAVGGCDHAKPRKHIGAFLTLTHIDGGGERCGE